jgi:putative endonuclease
MKAVHLLKGEQSESFARHWLESRGLTFVGANFRCRYGELDLIMVDCRCLVIIEVRFRSNPGYGGALNSVTPAKQQRLAKTAQYFMQQQRRFHCLPMRFDVLGLSGTATQPDIDWCRNAFIFDGTD